LEVEVVCREIVLRAGRSLALSTQCTEKHRFVPNKGRSIITSLIVYRHGQGHVGLSFGDRLRWHGVPAHRVDVEGGLHLHLRAQLKPRTGANSAWCSVNKPRQAVYRALSGRNNSSRCRIEARQIEGRRVSVDGRDTGKSDSNSYSDTGGRPASNTLALRKRWEVYRSCATECRWIRITCANEGRVPLWGI
jgi:hypothetical protein